MQVAGIIKNSVVNGVSTRDVVFFQGCKHRCRGCHNMETWSVYGGKTYTVDELLDELKDSPHDVTISGGEPLLQFAELGQFLKRLYEEQGKRCWVYTGYRYEELSMFMLSTLVRYVDVLVDGRFEEDKKDLTLQFKGSSNQRLIDLPMTIATGKIVEWRESR